MEKMEIKLRDVMDAMEDGQDISNYFDKQTGEVFFLTEDDYYAANDEDIASDWQQEAIEQIKSLEEDKLELDEEKRRYVLLPNQYDAHEWDMMARFVANIEDEDKRYQLNKAIHGSGAFRKFKSKIFYLKLKEQWFGFRDQCYRQEAIDWCEANDFKWVE